MVTDKYKLHRFKTAQSENYERALKEIRQGQKNGHWIWFIYPQLKGLGFSHMSQYYGISGLDEAVAYMEDNILGPRLRQITCALLDLDKTDVREILAYPDDLKLRSSMTLFDLASPGDIFAQVLDKFFSGQRDEKTIELLNCSPGI